MSHYSSNSPNLLPLSQFYPITGTTVDWEVSLQLSSAGPTSAVPPGWYFAPAGSHALQGNTPINRLNEWDVTKLGWFKSRRHRDHIDTGHQIRAAFSHHVRSCAANQVDAQVSSAYHKALLFVFICGPGLESLSSY